MKLEDECFVGEGELDDMWAVTFLSFSEGWLGLGVKTANPCGENFIDRILAFGSGRRHVDLVGGKSLEGRQERGLCFCRGQKPGLLPGFFLLAWLCPIGTRVRWRRGRAATARPAAAATFIWGTGFGVTHLVADAWHPDECYAPMQALHVCVRAIAKVVRLRQGAMDEADMDLRSTQDLRSAPEKVIMIKCRSCGKLNKEDSKFCQECGEQV